MFLLLQDAILLNKLHFDQATNLNFHIYIAANPQKFTKVFAIENISHEIFKKVDAYVYIVL